MLLIPKHWRKGEAVHSFFQPAGRISRMALPKHGGQKPILSRKCVRPDGINLSDRNVRSPGGLFEPHRL